MPIGKLALCSGKFAAVNSEELLTLMPEIWQTKNCKNPIINGIGQPAGVATSVREHRPVGGILLTANFFNAPGGKGRVRIGDRRHPA